jgi:hypothetical protein
VGAIDGVGTKYVVFNLTPIPTFQVLTGRLD